MWGKSYWGGSFSGPPYWGPGETVAAAPTRRAAGPQLAGKRPPNRWLLVELEHSLLETERLQMTRQLELLVCYQHLRREAYQEELLRQEHEQARTAITAVFLTEV